MILKLKKNISIILLLAGMILFSNQSFANNNKNDLLNTLNVYVKKSYLVKGGVSKYLEELFYSKYQGKIKWIPVNDNTDIKKDIMNHTDIDVVMGFSNIEMRSVISDGVLSRINYDNFPRISVDKKHYNFKYYIPFESFQLSFVYNKDKVKDVPKTLKDLILNTNYTIIIKDPSSSNFGLYLLYWINLLYQKKVINLFHALYSHVMLEDKDEVAYSKFLSGDADFVFTYSSRPSFKKLLNKNSKYASVLFDEGNIEIHKYVGIYSGSRKTDLANAFISMLLSKAGQKIVVYKNYAYPVIYEDINILSEITEYKNHPIYINTDKFVKNISTLKNIWDNNFN